MKRKFMLFCACLLINIGWAIAQSSEISGVVLSAENGEPVVGASILVEGTTVGTITDIDGKFTLKVNKGGKLQISYIGMKTKSLTAKDNMVVKLESDSELLEEVVVTGMQRMDKRLFSGAATQISGENVKMDGLADISRGLEGKAAGVSVQNAPKIRVRGATSIYGSSKPLWVVDGVIMEDAVEVSADQLSSGDAETLISSAIAGLNADDIESFQILKDGSATSIYGARAMAGVIVVTTKKGKSGVSKVNYTGEFTTRLVPSYNDFNIMNSQEQMGVYKQMEQKGWLNFSETIRAAESGVYGKMYQLMNTFDPVSGLPLLWNTEESKAQYLRQAEMRNTDWFDELFSPSLSQNHSVSLSGGTDKSSYYASLSAMYDPGWYKKSGVERYTANINTSYNISKWLSFNMIANASYRKQEAPGTLGQEVDVVSGEVKRDFDINPYSYALNTSRTLDPQEYYTSNYAPFNILNELDNNYIDLNIVDVKFQGELKWKPIAGLEFAALGAVKYQGTSQEHKIKDNSNQAEAYRAGLDDKTIMDKNPFLYQNPDNPYALPITVLPEGGIYRRTDYKMLSYDFRGTVNWNKVFDEVHLTNWFGGMEVNSIDRTKANFQGWGLQYANGETPYYVYEYFKRGIEQGDQYFGLNNSKVRSVAFFANVNYSYAGRYSLNGTVRYEGTNRMGKSRSSRWLPTWNVSGAWNVHEEKFFSALEPALSHLTFKASYSLTADRGPADVTNSKVIINSYIPFRPFTGIQEPGLRIIDLENSELTYEKKHELNLGVDVGFLNNRINFAMDWYTRNNYDLIGAVNTQGVGGTILKLANVASMKSHGVEFTLSTHNIKSKNFNWNTDFIFSKAENEVTDLQQNANVMDLVAGVGFAKQGYPVRGLFSIPFEKLDKNGIPVLRNESGQLSSTSFNFQERDNTDFLIYEGPTDPTITGSLGNVFTYKGFRLNVFMTYSFGNVVRLNPVFNAKYSDLSAMTREFKNRWTLPGDENVTNIPAIMSARMYNELSDYAYAYNAYNYSNVRVAKGDFIRLKEISLSYDFPKNWIKPLLLSNLSLKIQATNLFLLYADKKLNGQDPEFFNAGGVASPVPRQFTLTLRLGL